MYSVFPHTYKNMLTNNITTTCKKTTEDSVNAVNREAKAIVKPFKIEDRLKQYSNNEAFITLKDHKDHFMGNPKCRVINPAKSDVGLVSKKMLDNINNAIRKKSNLNQGWRLNDYVPSYPFITQTVSMYVNTLVMCPFLCAVLCDVNKCLSLSLSSMAKHAICYKLVQRYSRQEKVQIHQI